MRIASAMVWAIGCASGAAAPAAQPTAPPASRAEQSAPPAAEPEPAAESPVETAPSGPGRITIEARVRDKSVAADIRILAASGEEVAHGSTGEAMQLGSGEYELQVTIRDAAALADKPMQRRTLTLARGDDLHEHVDFPWAMIQLNVVVNGSPDRSAVVHLMRQGGEVAVLKSGADPVAISPGRYSAQVKTHGASIEVPEVMFPDGATQTVPVRVQM